ncbi:MAG: MCE family protein [Granulosicoccus sp.]|nr:MCE family protein [Granulosicoccus sp.]
MTNSTRGPASSRIERAANLSARLSLAWLLPLAALLFAGWILWSSYTDRGPLVEITFDKAGGVTAGETRVRRNDVDVGRVESVRLANDLNSVVVSVRMDPQVAPHMDENTRFWIVNARINTTEVSGLSTLLSGSYIEVDWDESPGTRQSDFIGLDEPPLTTRGTPGLRLTLNADEAGYIYVGSPVFLRQIEVGRVERRRLSDDATKVLFDIFIEAPHHRNVYPQTRFYGVSGIEGRVDSTGAMVRVESIAALFTGGIAFENPEHITVSTPVTNSRKPYKLFGSRTEARNSLFDGEDDIRFRFQAEFSGSVKGLRVDAPIEYNGVKVGTVASVEADLPGAPGETGSAKAVLQFQPARFGLEDITPELWHEFVGKLVDNGLRARLTTGNLLTGSLIVEMINKPELAGDPIDFTTEPYASLPVLATDVEAVTADIETLIKNLSELPLDSLVSAATELLREARTLVASPQLATLPAQISSSMSSIANAAARVETASASLPAMVSSLTAASRNANEVLEGLSPDSEIYIELSATARELRTAAKSIAAFAELLEENPNALFTGR